MRIATARKHVKNAKNWRLSGKLNGGKMNIKDVQETAYQIAVNNGFYDRGESFGDRLALIHSEVSEAFECYRRGMRPEPELIYSTDGHPIGIPFELADVVLRVVGVCENYGANLQRELDVRLRYVLHDLLKLDDGHLTFNQCGVAAVTHFTIQKVMRPQLPGLTFGDMISHCHNLVSHTERCWPSLMTNNPAYLSEDMGSIVMWVTAMAHHFNIDLDAAIAAKLEYNRNREYRHGDKLL